MLSSFFFRMPSRFCCLHSFHLQRSCVGCCCTYILLQHETARALDNKWFRRSISDRDRFSTWQHISDDRLVPGVGARAG